MGNTSASGSHPMAGHYITIYKGYHSIILMAVVDADYKFIWYDLGIPGSFSDAQIYHNSELKEGIDNGTLGIPPAEPLPGDDDTRPIRYFLIGDDAFALRTSMMKPYCTKSMPREERIFITGCPGGAPLSITHLVSSPIGSNASYWSDSRIRTLWPSSRKHALYCTTYAEHGTRR